MRPSLSGPFRQNVISRSERKGTAFKREARVFNAICWPGWLFVEAQALNAARRWVFFASPGGEQLSTHCLVKQKIILTCPHGVRHRPPPFRMLAQENFLISTRGVSSGKCFCFLVFDLGNGADQLIALRNRRLQDVHEVWRTKRQASCLWLSCSYSWNPGCSLLWSELDCPHKFLAALESELLALRRRKHARAPVTFVFRASRSPGKPTSLSEGKHLTPDDLSCTCYATEASVLEFGVGPISKQASWRGIH